MRNSGRPSHRDHVDVRLTGHPRARVEGAWEQLPLDLGAAILFHLAVRGTWCARAAVAALFWSESADAEAFRKLRQHLQRLKMLPWAADLEVERERLRWAPRTDLWAFERAWDAKELRRALDHYHGPLLEGLRIDVGPDFEAWLRTERCAWHDRWRQAAFRVVDDHLDSEVTPWDAESMAAVRSADPFDEAALRREMLVWEALGEREPALRTFVRFTEWLSKEVDSAPEDETMRVVDRLRNRHRGTAPFLHAPQRLDGLVPAFDAPLLGRSGLLAELIATLDAQDGPRLVTLWGPGGVGKTHLAVALARTWDARKARPSLFVPSEHADGGPAMFRGIADALRQRDDSVAAVGRALDHQVGLLVLDNLEQIDGAGEALARLLRHAPRIRVLATSRRVLGEALGQAFRVSGLEHHGHLRVEVHDARNLESWLERRPAEALVFQRAQRRRPGLASVLAEDPETRTALTRIARFTAGLPLALALAAGWTSALTIPEVAEQLERGTSVLRSQSSDLPERHRSIESVLEQSWRMVPSDDRDLLPALSVFRGGFDRSAAEAVTGVDARRLRAWVEWSWLERSGNRFQLHPLARRFLAAQLDPELRLRVERRHAHHYAALLEAEGAALVGPNADLAMQRLTADRENLRAFWQRAVRSGWPAEIARAAHGLYEFLDIARAHSERTELLEAAVKGLTDDARRGATARSARTRCRIMLLGSARECDDLLQELRDAESTDTSTELDRALALSRASRLDPDLAAARGRWREAADIYRERGRHDLEGSAALRFAERLEDEPRHPEMVKVLEHAAALFDLAGSNDHAVVARVRRARGLGALGDETGMRAELALCRHGIRNAHPAARRYLHAEWLRSHVLLALNQGRSRRARWLIPRYLRALNAIGVSETSTIAGHARIAEIEQNWEQALSLWRKAAQEPGIDHLRALLGVARARTALGHLDAASVAIRECRRMTGAEDAWTLVALAHWLIAKGEPELAAQIAAAVSDHATLIGFASLGRSADEISRGLRSKYPEIAGLIPSASTVVEVATAGWRRFAELSDN